MGNILTLQSEAGVAMRPVNHTQKAKDVKPSRDDFPYTKEFELLVLRFKELPYPLGKDEVVEFMDHYLSVYRSLPSDGRCYADWMIDLVGNYGRSGISRTQCVIPERLQ